MYSTQAPYLDSFAANILTVPPLLSNFSCLLRYVYINRVIEKYNHVFEFLKSLDFKLTFSCSAQRVNETTSEFGKTESFITSFLFIQSSVAVVSLNFC